MKRPQFNTSTQFLNTDQGKTESNSIEIPSISLPNGGGAIKGIDEKFSVNAVNGTAAFSIPLPFSKARDFSPSHNLVYNSGAGNGNFGLGWRLDIPSIKRKTDKGLPQYQDAKDSDIFLFSEAEDLVPAFRKNEDGSFKLDEGGEYIIYEKPSEDNKFIIRYYKPRVEGLYARIERWIDKTTREIKWRITTKENVTTLFGWTEQARIINPKDATKIFEWLPEFIFDSKGNCTHYIYKKEDSAGINKSLLHNRNRIKSGNISYTNTYLKKICYGNKTPYKHFGDAFPQETDYFFTTEFDYGEHDKEQPDEINKEWSFRKDAFSNYKPGFEIRTTRLCKRVLLFHHFKGEEEYNGLVRSVNFNYDTSSEKDFTFLKTVTSCGYIKKEDGSYSMKQMPPMEFEYQDHAWNKDLKTVKGEDLVQAPVGLDENQYQFTDLYNEGLSGILTEQANGWYYKHNLGYGNFEQAKLVTPKPSFVGLGATMQLADLDADGGKQLVSYNTQPKGYFELDDKNQWHALRSFQSLPNINFGDPNTRMLDLDGDGKPELVISEEHAFTWYASKGRDGFQEAQTTPKSFDEEEGPHMVFADSQQTIFLADMSGDGMTDIVRIRNGAICYWPNLGYGNFGAKVAMDNAPVFDSPESFNPNFLKLADINGSGVTDVVYLGKSKFSCWLNLSGNAFSNTPFEIDPFPEIDSHTKITVTDLLGNGVACIVWSSALPKNRKTPLKYIDLMNGKKPHVMVGYKNNMGKEVSFDYAPSTKFYIEDKLAGKPWATKLHFPVHCVAMKTIRDNISGYRFTTSYKYHHGYYDHAEREFRGFGMVEQIDSEDFGHWKKGDNSNIVEASLHQEPVVSKSWFHTGAFADQDEILKQYENEHWSEEMRRQGFDTDSYENELRGLRLTAAQGLNEEILTNLSIDELRESHRSCKGIMIREEIFARDALKFGNTDEAKKRELIPYTVGIHNCKIQLIQPKGKNKHAVFGVLESEAMTYEYEREAEDPRVSHKINVKADEFGNILESAEIIYPRRKVDETLPDETQTEQSKTNIIYTHHSYTNDVMDEDNYLLRLPSEVKTYELNNIPKDNDYFVPDDFKQLLENIEEVDYHEIAPSFTDSYKRCIEHVRTIYLSDDLTTPLPLHQLVTHGLIYENFQLAFTPALINEIFEDKVTSLMMANGKYTHSEEGENWWIRSGTVQYKRPNENIEEIKNRFYMPVSYTDPYGTVTEVAYYKDYYIFIESTTNALGSTQKVQQFNFRALSPQIMKDINGNFTASLTDELGLVKGTAMLGKGNDADHLETLDEITDDAELELKNNFFNAEDSESLTIKGKELLKGASTRFVYNFDNYMQRGKPAVVASIKRVEHYVDNPDSSIQIGFEYSNGIGEVVMQKKQAEPGIAKKVKVDQNNDISIEEINTAEESPAKLRWIGTGRTIKNNKGNSVKKYEPYFSLTWQYEDVKELVESGVTPLIYYDALGRQVKNELPDGTFTKVAFDAWRQSTFDGNDTILESKWYDDRIHRKIDEKLIAAGKNPEAEKTAAERAAKHAKTPVVQHLDNLGRPILSVEHNKDYSTGEVKFYNTKAKLDIEGNLLMVTDARDNKVMQYAYDMLGNLVFENSMDAGKRWMLTNILSEPYLIWDENERVDNGGNLQQEKRIFRTVYDILQRPIEQQLKINEQDWNLIEKIIYGENEPEAHLKNLRGEIHHHFDSSGLIINKKFDFKGNLLSASRQLTQTIDESIIDWNTEAPSQELYLQETKYDALSKMVQMQNWHLENREPGVYTPVYNERRMLQAESLSVNRQVIEAVRRIEYNAKGQKILIKLDNGTTTRYHYDAETFRLNQLKTTKGNNGREIPSPPSNLSDQNVFQNLYYTYDPVGNITQIVDDAYEPVYFNNQAVESKSSYEYDALYRLVKASGREHHNLTGPPGQTDQLSFEVNFPVSEQALRNYKQYYEYDQVGNILQMRHIANGESWTRNYKYDTESNRLLKTFNGDQEANAIHYQYDTHGSILNLGNNPDEYFLQWDYRDMLHTVNLGGGGTAHYQYDVQKERSRKYLVRNGSQREERIYLGGFERYRRWDGDTLVEEIETHHLFAEEERVLITEHVLETNNNNLNTGILHRYQYSNHLGSAALELSGEGDIISYEEYHPFGTSAYQATNKALQAASKRYRYTGMERDEETGLSYHSARFYMPWLGRWLSTDPIGIEDGVNVYRYVRNQTTRSSDRNGKQMYQHLGSGHTSNSNDNEEEVSEKCTYDAEADLEHSIERLNNLQVEVNELYERHSALRDSFENSLEIVQEEAESNRENRHLLAAVETMNKLLDMEDEIDNLNANIEMTGENILRILENHPDALDNLRDRLTENLQDYPQFYQGPSISELTPEIEERSISMQEYYERLSRRIEVGRAISSSPTATLSAIIMMNIDPNVDFGDERNHARIIMSGKLLDWARQGRATPSPHNNLGRIVIPQPKYRQIGSKGPSRGDHSDRQVHIEHIGKSGRPEGFRTRRSR